MSFTTQITAKPTPQYLDMLGGLISFTRYNDGTKTINRFSFNADRKAKGWERERNARHFEAAYSHINGLIDALVSATRDADKPVRLNELPVIPESDIVNDDRGNGWSDTVWEGYTVPAAAMAEASNRIIREAQANTSGNATKATSNGVTQPEAVTV